MATGLNMFSVVEEISSPAFRKIAALVSPKRGYPELPDLSDNPRPSYIITLKTSEWSIITQI